MAKINNNNNNNNNNEEKNMKQKIMAAFAAANIEVDEFIAAAAAEKEANRLRRAHEETARALVKARKEAETRRIERKLAGVKKETRRAARRDARRAHRTFDISQAEAWKRYIKALKEEALITNANSYDAEAPEPTYGNKMLPEMTGVSSEVHLAACCRLYGTEIGRAEALFTIPGTSIKAISCKSDGFKTVKNADLVITDEGVFDWFTAKNVGEECYDYDRDRSYTVIEGEVAQFTLEDGSKKTVVLATSIAKLTRTYVLTTSQFKVSFGHFVRDTYKVETQEDIIWVLHNCHFESEMTDCDEEGNEFVSGAYVSLKTDVQLPQREESIITFTLEELKALYQENNGEKFVHKYSFIQVDDETPLDGTVHYCSECGYFSEPYGDGTVWDEGLHIKTQLMGYDYSLVATDGKHFYGVSNTTCEHCRREQVNNAVNAAITVEEALATVNITDYAFCPVCGKIVPARYTFPTISEPVQKLYRLNGSTVESFVTAEEECDRCKTTRCGGGLDGVKDDITVNHGLWAFYKDENNVHGALRRFRNFLQLSKTAEFCATESTQFVGDFGITIEHPQITAAFGYGKSDAWSERDGEQRHATRNFDYGVKTRKQFNAEVEYNLQHGHNGSKYVELIVSMGESSKLQALWIKSDFFRGHPHFSRALVEVANDAGLPAVVVDVDTAEITTAQEYQALYMEAGLNALVSNYTVQESDEEEYYNTPDSWSLGHRNQGRINIRYYLFNLLVNKAVTSNISRDRKAIILCGLPGSGKSTIARKFKDEYTIVDPDVIKWLLPEYTGGNASFVHKESSKIASWVNQYLAVRGFNVVIPMIGDNKSLERVKHIYDETGYQVDIQFVDTCPEKCFERIQGRKRSINITLEKLQESYKNIIDNIEVL